MEFISENIYNLKLEYGQSVAIYSVLSQVTSPITGEIIIEKKKYFIPKAILLLSTFNISMFIRGVLPFQGILVIDNYLIVDGIDVNNIKINDYAVINNKRFQIKNIEKIEYESKILAYLLALKTTEGQKSNDIIETILEQELEFEQESINEIN